MDLVGFAPAGIRHAIATGLGPALHRATCNGRRHKDPSLEQELLSADWSARVLVHEHLDALEDILAGLGEYARQVTLLKGISICQTHYPEPHLRLMGDIDLLVPAGIIPTVETRLRDLGYRQQSDYPPEFYRGLHHGMPFFHARRQLWVEVHRSLFPSSASVARDRVFSPQHVTAQTVLHEFRGLRCLRLSEELQLVYVCAHWAEELDPSRGLVALLDALYLLRRTPRPLDWGALLAALAGSAALTPLALVTDYLERQGLVSLPPGVAARLAAQARPLNAWTKPILRVLIDRFLVKGRPFGRFLSPTNTAIIWKTLLAPAAPTLNLARLPWNLLLPPGEPRRHEPRFQLGRLASAFSLRRRG